MGGRTVRQFQMVTGRMRCSWSSFFWGALRSPRIVLRCVMAALAFACAVFPPGTAKAATFVVNSLADRIDAAPGDGVCGDLLGLCTLRAAITEANASRANDTILFAVSGTIVLLATLPEVPDATTAGTLEINGSGQVTVSGNDRVRILSVGYSGNLTLRNIRLERGRADVGGAIYSDGATLTIANTTFSGNSAMGGGAIYSLGGMLTTQNSTFIGNSASSGGAIRFDWGTMQALGVRLWDNQAGLEGGGLYLAGTADIRALTIARNTSRRGAGVFSTGELRLVNATFSENAATEDGGGFFGQSLTDIANIVFSTFYANTAGARGSAIFDETGSTRVKNSVVVGSGAASNCFGVFLPRGRNYSTDESCPGFTVAAPHALRLGPLADNGGPTETHALLSGSVAIDSAPDCNDLEGGAVTSDQRGASRRWGASCDVGAYEAGAPVTPFGPTRTPTPTFLSPSRTPTETVAATPRPTCPGDCGGDGQVTIDELVTMVNIALGGKPVSECSVGDTSGDGEITIDEIIQAVNRALNGC